MPKKYIAPYSPFFNRRLTPKTNNNNDNKYIQSAGTLHRPASIEDECAKGICQLIWIKIVFHRHISCPLPTMCSSSSTQKLFGYVRSWSVELGILPWQTRDMRPTQSSFDIYYYLFNAFVYCNKGARARSIQFHRVFGHIVEAHTTLCCGTGSSGAANSINLWAFNSVRGKRFSLSRIYMCYAQIHISKSICF